MGEPMIEVRIHGRGGQGVVTAAELLSAAAFEEGLHAQAFPSFGSERSGAPVVSYCRFAEAPIRTREPVAEPDALIVQDPTLLHQVDLFDGVGADARILINSSRSLDDLGLGEFGQGFRPERLMTVPATDVARRCLGRPLPNAALVGGFAALTGWLGLEAVTAAIGERFPGVLGERNAAAARETFGLVESEIRQVAGA
jgi:pyruvate ferredoxin oxidoreductase gamma subunit